MRRSDDSHFEEWVSRNIELVIILIASIGTMQLRKKYEFINTYYVAALTARLGVEAAGLIIAQQIDGQSGIDSWRRYSNRVFANDTLPDNIPVISDVLGILPDPVEVGMIAMESLATIGAHYDVESAVSGEIRRLLTYNPATISGRDKLLTTSFSVAKTAFDRGITILPLHTR